MAILSVIVPVHNTAPYLKKSVDSIRNQTLKDIEIILVENLSTDGSSEMCDEIAQIDSRIKVLHIQIADLSTARNEGIKVASAPYVGFIDSDDYIDPDMYESILTAMMSNNAEMGNCSLIYEYETGQSPRTVSNTGQILVMDEKKFLKDTLSNKYENSVTYKVFRKELFSTIRFPEKYFFEDRYIIYQLVNLCSCIIHVDKPFYHYIQHEGSICHTLNFTKHYHFFLAEYYRIEYIRTHNVFSEEEYPPIISKIVGELLIRFKDALLTADANDVKKTVPGMRKQLKKLLSLQIGELDTRTYKRLRKMFYFTYIYRNFHLRRNKLRERRKGSKIN